MNLAQNSVSSKGRRFPLAQRRRRSLSQRAGRRGRPGAGGCWSQALRVLPASFRVVLHEPRQFSELFREFCPQLGPDGKPACVEGVDEVVDQHQVVWSTLAGPWLHTTDAAVLLAPGVDPNRQEAIRRDLEALPVVEQVDFESAAAAAGRFQQSGVQDPVALDNVAFYSLRVRLRGPRQFPTLYGRLCSGRSTSATKPVCKPGVSFAI